MWVVWEVTVSVGTVALVSRKETMRAVKRVQERSPCSFDLQYTGRKSLGVILRSLCVPESVLASLLPKIE